MVFCGRPSKGCAKCRERRIKCDHKQPGCTQCGRLGQYCPGYRDEISLAFRDQSEDIILKYSTPKKKGQNAVTRPRKISQKASPGSSLSSGSSSPPSWAEFYEASSSGSQVVTKTLSMSLVDEAAQFFFNDYVVEDWSEAGHTFSNVLPAIYRKARSDSVIVHAVTALGIASISNAMKMPAVMLHAQRKYVSALHGMKEVMKNPVAATSDETLMIVTLLSMYEEAYGNLSPAKFWKSHMQGALAILDLRGLKQLQTRSGCQLIDTLRTHMIAACMKRHTQIPHRILEWSKLACEYEVSQQIPVCNLADIFGSFCGLLERMKLMHGERNSAKELSDAMAIDTSLEYWASKFPLHECCTEMRLKRPCEYIFDNHWTGYSSLSAATDRNHYRSIRILINQIILNAVTDLDVGSSGDVYLCVASPREDQIDKSRSLILELSQEICASTPYCLGWNPDRKEKPSRRPQRAARGMFLLWPLYVSGNNDIIPTSLRLWICEILQEIADLMGIRKATELAKILRLREEGQHSDVLFGAKQRHWRDI